MGLFFHKRVEKRYTVLKSNALAHWALVFVILLTIGSRYTGFQALSDFGGWIVLVLAFIHVFESWPAIRASWSKKDFEKRGSHVLSGSDPLEYWIPI